MLQVITWSGCVTYSITEFQHLCIIEFQVSQAALWCALHVKWNPSFTTDHSKNPVLKVICVVRSPFKALIHSQTLSYNRPILTSPMDNVLCLKEILNALFSSDTRQCLTVKSKCVCVCSHSNWACPFPWQLYVLSNCRMTVPDSGSHGKTKGKVSKRWS